MLYYQFKDYEDFKSMFGLRETQDGRKVRQNKILLEFLRSKEMRQAFPHEFYQVSSMTMLKSTISYRLKWWYMHERYPNVFFMDMKLYSKDYHTDILKGICEDNTSNRGFVRVINSDDRVVKIRMGRLIKSVMETYSTCSSVQFPEAICRWYEQEITEDWKSFVTTNDSEIELHVNDNFEDIYDSSKCGEGFNSCMFDKEFECFYRNCVDASAAYLTKGDVIIARAVIFNQVHEEGSSKIWRLCERQYCIDEDNSLKKLLVEQLIEGGYIDGFKAIGASCHDPRNYVGADKERTSLKSKKFYIKIDAIEDNEVPYMDSFKYYNHNARLAYNYYPDDNYIELENTDGAIGLNWDDYNERYCQSTRGAYYHGDYYNVDTEDESFSYCDIDDNWHHEDDIVECPQCGNSMLDPEYYSERSYYSRLTKEYYCCNRCKEECEEEYREENWNYCEYDGVYVEDECDCVKAYEMLNKEYFETTVSWETLQSRIEHGFAIEYQGKYYLDFDCETDLPYGVETETKTA